jgi:hypothetical protein
MPDSKYISRPCPVQRRRAGSDIALGGSAVPMGYATRGIGSTGYAERQAL